METKKITTGLLTLAQPVVIEQCPEDDSRGYEPFHVSGIEIRTLSTNGKRELVLARLHGTRDTDDNNVVALDVRLKDAIDLRRDVQHKLHIPTNAVAVETTVIGTAGTKLNTFYSLNS